MPHPQTHLLPRSCVPVCPFMFHLSQVHKMVMNIGKAPTFGDAEPKLRCEAVVGWLGVGTNALHPGARHAVLALFMPCLVSPSVSLLPQCRGTHHAPLQSRFLRPAAAPGGAWVHQVQWVGVVGRLVRVGLIWMVDALSPDGTGMCG